MSTETIILTGLMGSRSAGTDTETSDSDYMSVVLGNEDVYLGLDYYGDQGTKQSNTPSGEHTYYELRKFLKLCQGFNPNVIPLLYLDPYHYVNLDSDGQLLIEMRYIFTSKIAVESFGGYAYNQMKKMGSPGSPTGQMGAKRKDLRDKYGYDSKYFYHTIRLTRMLIEFIESGGRNLFVDRRNIDRQELLDFRNGILNYTEAMKLAEDHLEKVKKAFEKNPKCLPDKPNKIAIRELCKTILKNHLNLKT